MATFSKRNLSASSYGNNINVNTTSHSTLTIHTTGTGGHMDEIWLYATNHSGSDVKLTTEFGGAGSTEHWSEVTIGAEAGGVLVVPGLLLQNGLLVKAFAAAANVVMINGFVNRITA